VPAETRGIVLSRPETVKQAATNLYVRRAMAAQAEADGLAADPVIQAAIRIARDKVLSDALLEKIDRESTPTDTSLEGLARNIYRAQPDRYSLPEQVQVRHILIAGKDEKSRETAEKLLKDLKGGANFTELAKAHSADPGSAQKGGDLGSFARGRMVPEFEKAAFELKTPGELSDLVSTQFGFHILQLVERQAPRARPYEEVRKDIMAEVRAGVAQSSRNMQAQKYQQGMKVNEEAVRAVANGFRTKAQ
jgi:peptidyl-prolyl cis-trans isomerase C